MPWFAALIGAGVGLYGQDQQRGAIGRASGAQQAATRESLAQQQRMYDQYMQNMSPWYSAGRQALTAQQQLMGLGPQGSGANQLAALQSSPGYQFRLQQGQNSLDSGLAARGGMGGGRAMQAGVDYNQNFASNEYGNRLSQLGSMSNLGMGAAGGMGSAGMNFANNYGNTLQGGANAYGAGQIAGANANMGSLLGGVDLGLGLYRAFNQNNPNNPNNQNNQANIAQQQTSSSIVANPNPIDYRNPNSKYWGGSPP